MPPGGFPRSNCIITCVTIFMPQRPPEDELTVITRAYDLVREMTQRVGRFPRDYRFLLGDRILRSAYEIPDLLIACRALLETRGVRAGQGAP